MTSTELKKWVKFSNTPGTLSYSIKNTKLVASIIPIGSKVRSNAITFTLPSSFDSNDRKITTTDDKKTE